MNDHWTDFERALLAVLERIAEALEGNAKHLAISVSGYPPGVLTEEMAAGAAARIAALGKL